MPHYTGPVTVVVYFCSLSIFNCAVHLILMLLHALYERSCMAPLKRLPCYGTLRIIIATSVLLFNASDLEIRPRYYSPPTVSRSNPGLMQPINDRFTLCYTLPLVTGSNSCYRHKRVKFWSHAHTRNVWVRATESAMSMPSQRFKVDRARPSSGIIDHFGVTETCALTSAPPVKIFCPSS